MCINAGDNNPLCDECFDKEQKLIESGQEAFLKEEDMCADCREMIKKYCSCCNTHYSTKDEADIIEGVCKKCRDAL